MAALPYIKLFVGDYMADTRHLTTKEHGAYLLLIMAYWTRGGPLPNDDKILARLAGLGPREWAKVKPVVSAFFQVGLQHFAHKRLDIEIANAERKSLNNKRPGNANGSRSERDRLQHHSHSHSHIEDDPDKSGSHAGEPALDIFDDDLPPGESYTAAFEAWWSAYPNKTGKRAAAGAYDRAFKRLGGAKAGTAKIHAKLRTSAEAQARVWKRKGVEGKFIPHPATWLNQSRWDDAEVVKALANGTAGRPAAPPDNELAPAAPEPARAPCSGCGTPYGHLHPPSCPVRQQTKTGWVPEDA